METTKRENERLRNENNDLKSQLEILNNRLTMKSIDNENESAKLY